MHRKSNIFFISSNFKLLNSGSLCALYLLLVVVLIARFCNFNYFTHLYPQEVLENCQWDRIKDECIGFKAEKGK